jgi:hypothetical protein
MNCKKIGIVVLTVMAAVAAHSQTISTTYDTDIYDFGAPNTETYGQTFNAPNTELDSYSFRLNDFGNDQPFFFYVGTWTGSDVGSVLYDTYFPTANPGAGEVVYTVNADLAGLTTGSEYIAFISSSLAPQTGDYGVSQGGSYDSYSGGEFVFINNGLDNSQWFDGSWSTYGVPETAFTATFSGVSSTPGPAALAPFGMGLLAAARRRFRA